MTVVCTFHFIARLLQQSIFADDGRFLGLSVHGVHDADDGEYGEHDVHEAEGRAQRRVDASCRAVEQDEPQDRHDHTVNHAPAHERDQQHQPLIGVKAGEAQLFGRQQWHEYQNAEIGE